MAQEEQNHRCSGSSSGGGGGGGGGGRPSKKPKQKKIPQRGLGVAQLEKIRLEEQNKKNSPAAFFSDSSTLSSSNPSYSSLSLPNYHHSHSSSLIPFPSPSPPNLHSPTSQFRPPNIDVAHSNTVPLPNPISNGGFKIGFSPSIPVSGHGHVPKLWNHELNLEGENPRVDHGLVFQPPYESNPIWPLPTLMQRAQPYQQPSSSMVNVSSGTSSSPIPNFQIEPPSNQSYYGNNYTSMWPEEEKMVGVKRPYPFSLDNPPGPSFNSKFPTFDAPIRSDESASYGNGGTFILDVGNAIFREGPSCSTSLSEIESKKGIRENGGSNGDFLTLAPPSITSPHPNTRSKQPPGHPAYYNKDSSEFESLPYQGNTGDPIRPHPTGPLQHQQQWQQLPFYNFLQPANPQNGPAATSSSNCNGGEVGGSVDLNLKL
ncbi:hypothetical protein VitviT2T_029465 [Vitis vinifera]|uniref:Protein SPEAR2 n=1 Tax=Vitis vinifera TaxID=29760 RepID=A0ABY9DYP5_VITVI|nr:protein SPEAR2 isoform X2 [Vitis vinifera]WKA12026.1 hypothetical protein VitviT2T_029465 [Vitis vinifera]|eukprot:XP_010644146.1 PREDICTED: protein SPEAR2 isoform X2 [Vitis vinifera]